MILVFINRALQTSLIFNIIFVCLLASIESYPRIRISKFANIYSQSGQTKNTLKQDFSDEINTQLFAASDVCETAVCQTTGKSLKANLNHSVDPCDDFYEFACGGWVASHKIPDDKSMFFGDSGLEDIITKKLNDSLRHTRSASDPKPIAYASELYKTCIDNSTRESLGVAPLKTALHVLGGGWPITSTTFNEKTFNWSESLSTVVANFGYTPIFSFGVGPDANDTKVNRFNFGAASFGLGRNQLVHQDQYPEIVAAYKKLIFQAAVLLGAPNNSHTHQEVDEIVAFEAKLANETVIEEETGSSSVWYNRITFNALNQLSGDRVDWVKVINNIYTKINSSIRVKSDELVIVSDIEYYKVITKLVENTPKRVIANYFGWVVASSYGSLTNQAFRTADFHFSQVLSGALKDTQLWEDCVFLVSQTLEYAASRLYIETTFTKKDKEVASVIVNDIKESFDDLMKASQWLDSTTKAKALNKLDKIHQNVGYPDWILDNNQLEKYYNLTKKADPKHFFANMLYLQQRSLLEYYNSLREPVNLNTSWPMAPHIVNAAYEPTQNSITIPAGQLTPPYFDVRLPAYVNYGSIGAVVGHELTHGFDDQGSQFDANGNFRNWWTKEVSEKFNEKADCFINEYNSYLDPQSKMKLNGNITVGENIADNGGIRESYNAYLKYEKKHGKQQRLPVINQYTPEQQFFISYANTWCTKYRTEYLKEMIQYNPHSPAKYRVNLPLANFKTFSDVFKCSANSRMNRKDKCVLW